jgi:hypothetical protein
MARAQRHRWQFAAHFRRSAFDWRSQPAVTREQSGARSDRLTFNQRVSGSSPERPTTKTSTERSTLRRFCENKSAVFLWQLLGL